MFVCICNAVTDHQIKETIAAGATTMGDLQSQLGVARLLRLLRGACRFVSDGAQRATDGYGGYQRSSVKRFWKCRLNCSDGIFAVFGRT